MVKDPHNVYYSDYLQLQKILDAQYPKSVESGSPAHDEMLFIIVHQAYELWFKQILHELNSVIAVFRSPQVDERVLATMNARLERIQKIQALLIDQIDVIETMTPMDFLDFRDLLVPASGFQSVQFKLIEIRLGLRRQNRIAADRDFFETRLVPGDLNELDRAEQEPGLLQLTEQWLERMPFLQFEQFDFWKQYRAAVHQMLDSDLEIIRRNPSISEKEREFQREALAATRADFDALLDPDKYNSLKSENQIRISQQAFLAAIFIFQYRDEPMLAQPFRYLTSLMEIDEMFTRWRSRHALMVQRMLGTKIGTGGSSGHDYLSQTTRQNRVFMDLYRLSTYLIPRSALPALPKSLQQELGFHFYADA